MIAVAAKGIMEDLVQIANFHSPRRMLRVFVPNSDKSSILIEPAFRSPICVIEVVEQLIPTNDRHSRQPRQFTPYTEKLSESQTDVVA